MSPAVPEASFWVVWAPEAAEPPSVTFRTQAQAERVARKLAARQRGRVFLVMEVRGYTVTTPGCSEPAVVLFPGAE